MRREQDIARFRPDLKLLISSATMDAEKFSEYFDYAPIFKAGGKGRAGAGAHGRSSAHLHRSSRMEPRAVVDAAAPPCVLSTPICAYWVAALEVLHAASGVSRAAADLDYMHFVRTTLIHTRLRAT